MGKRAKLAAAIAAISGVSGLIGPTTPAHAYDRSTCTNRYGAAAVERASQFKVDTGPSGGLVDFGDDPHWFGAPQGTAVICWLNNGGAYIKGRVFADSWNEIFVHAYATFMRADGTTVVSQPVDALGARGGSGVLQGSAGARNGSRVTRVYLTLQRRDPSPSAVYVTDYNEYYSR